MSHFATDQDAWDDFARRTIRAPAHVYRRRRLAVLLITGVILLIGLAIAEGVITNEAPPTNSPDILTVTDTDPCWAADGIYCGPAQIPAPVISSDGRYHTCGIVTEDGVTEYLDAYAERCGDLTYAGDTDR